MFTSLGREGAGEMGDGEVGQESGERKGRVWMAEKWKCTKK